MAALARVSPESFVFMGGDTCHHAGQFRPSHVVPCPTALFDSIPSKNAHEADHAFFQVASRPPTVYHDPETARQSITKLQAFDAHPDVLVIIAHDVSLLPLLSFFPEGSLDDWKASGLKEKGRWAFVSSENPGFRL